MDAQCTQEILRRKDSTVQSELASKRPMPAAPAWSGRAMEDDTAAFLLGLMALFVAATPAAAVEAGPGDAPNPQCAMAASSSFSHDAGFLKGRQGQGIRFGRPGLHHAQMQRRCRSLVFAGNTASATSSATCLSQDAQCLRYGETSKRVGATAVAAPVPAGSHWRSECRTAADSD
jgi:hypothetical protein